MSWPYSRRDTHAGGFLALFQAGPGTLLMEAESLDLRDLSTGVEVVST